MRIALVVRVQLRIYAICRYAELLQLSSSSADLTAKVLEWVLEKNVSSSGIIVLPNPASGHVGG